MTTQATSSVLMMIDWSTHVVRLGDTTDRDLILPEEGCANLEGRRPVRCSPSHVEDFISMPGPLLYAFIVND